MTEFGTPGPHQHWKDNLGSCSCWVDPLKRGLEIEAKLRERDKEIDTLRRELVADYGHAHCQSEILKLKSLLGKERDEFGKRETELMKENMDLNDHINELTADIEGLQIYNMNANTDIHDLQGNIAELVEALEEVRDNGHLTLKASNLLAKHTKLSGSSGAGKEGCVCSGGTVVHRTDGPCYQWGKE